MPTKAEQKLITAAINGFNTRYASDENWGHDRWYQSLLPALQRPTRHAALVNQFVPKQAFDDLLAGSQIGPIEPLILPQVDNDASTSSANLTVYVKPLDLTQESTERESLFPPPIKVQVGSHTLLSHWNLDAASLICAQLLNVQPTDQVLDLCAAPGGKSLAIAQLLFSGPCSIPPPCLHVNELDSSRNKRLTQNLHSYLPPNLFASATPRIRILSLDASLPTSHSRLPLNGNYDKILLDAPCSSERHLLHSHLKATSSGRPQASELARWRRGQSKAIAKTQAGLLMTALRAVKTGGRIVYSTCSIETGENDGVVLKVQEMVSKGVKKGDVDFGFECLLGRARAKAADAETGKSSLKFWSEETEYGRIALPDHPSGERWGPLFFCVIVKTPATALG